MKTIFRGRCQGAGSILALLTALSLANAQAPTPADNKAPVLDTRDAGPDLSDYVSPNLDPEERGFMRAYMNGLPRAMKERIVGRPVDSISVAVVDGGANIVHYSRPEDAGSYEVVPAIKLPGSDRPDSSPQVKNPGVYGGSGPYRRVYTVPLPAATGTDSDAGPYYQQSGVVTTTCKAGKFTMGQDRGYSYMGGWSPTWNAESGAAATSSAVDAGLIYNYGASLKSADDYALFINVGNKVAIMSTGNGKKGTDPSNDYALPPHISCRPVDRGASPANTAIITLSVVGVGQLRSVAPECWRGKGNDTTFIGFPIASCTTFALVLHVESENFLNFEGKSHAAMIIWVSPDVSWGGWAHLKKITAKYWNGKYNVPGYVSDVTCANCIFKWMTSIAQTTENLHDGAAYGAAWLDREVSGFALKQPSPQGGELVPLTPAITDCSEYPLWHASYPKKYDTDCTNTPSGLSGVAQSITVRDYVPEGEWDIIELKY